SCVGPIFRRNHAQAISFCFLRATPTTAPYKRRRTRRANRIRGASDRISVEMRITLGRCRLRMTKELADDWQSEASAGSYTGELVTQVMNANAGK
ncbi:MAG: hypothetical protein AB7U61_08460, partial [Methylocystis sp.]